MSTAKDRMAAAISQRYGERLALPALPNLDALAVLNGRSVCRRYKPDPVPEAVLRLLCATALAAPTKSDLQQATLIRVADPAKRLALAATVHTDRYDTQVVERELGAYGARDTRAGREWRGASRGS